MKPATHGWWWWTVLYLLLFAFSSLLFLFPVLVFFLPVSIGREFSVFSFFVDAVNIFFVVCFGYATWHVES